MSKVLNFDQFMAEKNKATVHVTVLGKAYEVPAEIPAIVPIMMARAERSGNPVDNTNMIMRAADSMFGTEAINEMCRNGLTAPDLVVLISKLFETIKAPDEEDESEELTDEDSRTTVKGGKSAKK